MIDPNPPNDEEYSLRGIDRPQPADDRYKISIIKFMRDDAVAAELDLRNPGMAKNRFYPGVRKSDIRNALGPNGPLIGAGDVRLGRMLDELEKLNLVEITRWSGKKRSHDRIYYTLTEGGKEIWDELQKLKKEKISKLLYCLKDLDGVFQRNSGMRLEKKSNLEKVQSAGKF